MFQLFLQSKLLFIPYSKLNILLSAYNMDVSHLTAWQKGRTVYIWFHFYSIPRVTSHAHKYLVVMKTRTMLVKMKLVKRMMMMTMMTTITRLTTIFDKFLPFNNLCIQYKPCLYGFQISFLLSDSKFHSKTFIPFFRMKMGTKSSSGWVGGVKKQEAVPKFRRMLASPQGNSTVKHVKWDKGEIAGEK